MGRAPGVLSRAPATPVPHPGSRPLTGTRSSLLFSSGSSLLARQIHASGRSAVGSKLRRRRPREQICDPDPPYPDAPPPLLRLTSASPPPHLRLTAASPPPLLRRSSDAPPTLLPQWVGGCAAVRTDKSLGPTPRRGTIVSLVPLALCLELLSLVLSRISR
jgi:hypothetical protein